MIPPFNIQLHDFKTGLRALIDHAHLDIRRVLIS